MVHGIGGLVRGVDGVLIANFCSTGTFLGHVRAPYQLGPETPALTASQLRIQGDIVVGILWGGDHTPMMTGMEPPAAWGPAAPGGRSCGHQGWQQLPEPVGTQGIQETGVDEDEEGRLTHPREQ